MLQLLRRLNEKLRQLGNSNQSNQVGSGEMYVEPLETRNLLGTFTGTNGDDLVIVTFVADQPRTVEVNGVVFDNLDSTAEINLLLGNDEIRFQGAAINAVIDGYQTEDQGSVNGSVTFDFQGRITFQSADADDSIDVTGTDLASPVNIRSNGGADSVTYRGGRANIETGDGDDTLHLHSRLVDELSLFDGGDGWDTWQFAAGVSGRVELRGVDQNGRIFLGFDPGSGDPLGLSGRYYDIEKIIAPPPSTVPFANAAFPYQHDTGLSGFQGVDWHIDGNMAWGFSEPYTTTPIVLENFNLFRYHDDLPDRRRGLVSVVATDYPLNLSRFGQTKIGFQQDPLLGGTSAIKHAITVRTSDLQVSDAIGGEHNVVLDLLPNTSFQLSGLTEVPIEIVQHRDFKFTTLWGAAQAINRFFIEANQTRLRLYGGAANDAFHLGGRTAQDLDRLNKRVIEAFGGGGQNRIYVRDQNSPGNRSYQLQDGFLAPHWQTPGESSKFLGVYFSEIFALNLFGNDQINTFCVTPSTTTLFVVHGLKPDLGPGDRLIIVSNRDFRLHSTGILIAFDPGPTDLLPVRLFGIEHLESESQESDSLIGPWQASIGSTR